MADCRNKTVVNYKINELKLNLVGRKEQIVLNFHTINE